MRSADPNAGLRALLDDWDRPQDPSGGVAIDPTPPHPLAVPVADRQDPPTASSSALPADPLPSTTSPPAQHAVCRGDVVAWWHGTRPQLGVVQNVGGDGRAWLRPLDWPDLQVPQPLGDLVVVVPFRELLRDAQRLLTLDGSP